METVGPCQLTFPKSGTVSLSAWPIWRLIPLIRSALLTALLFLVAHSSYGQASSNFVTVTLPRGVSVQVPKGWWLIGAELNRAIETSAEAAMDLSGIGVPEGSEVNLISANSMPRTTYAALRIDSTIPPSSPAEFVGIPKAELQALEEMVREHLLKLLPMQGNKLLEFLGCRVEQISGYPTLVTTYRRTGPKGPILVQISQVVTNTHDVSIILSYRESEIALWGSVIGKIRKSVVVR